MCEEISYDEQKELSDVWGGGGVIGNSQVNCKRMECTPSWIVRNELEKEHSKNWETAYIEVDEEDVPRKSNVVS